jgi:hypothetical protein
MDPFSTRPRRTAGRAITPEEFDRLSDDELARRVPRDYRDYFPGKDGCVNGSFYLHDGTVWSFFKGSLLDE